MPTSRYYVPQSKLNRDLALHLLFIITYKYFESEISVLLLNNQNLKFTYFLSLTIIKNSILYVQRLAYEFYKLHQDYGSLFNKASNILN